jgi:hypothetical protein
VGEVDVAKSLKQERWRGRASACRVLAMVGTSKSVPALRPVLAGAKKADMAGVSTAKAAQAALEAIKARK